MLAFPERDHAGQGRMHTRSFRDGGLLAFSHIQRADPFEMHKRGVRDGKLSAYAVSIDLYPACP